MNGADLIVRVLSHYGANLCLTNPGTTELGLVEALSRSTEVQSVLVLQEGVATGAVDGYVRTSKKRAWALLHLGPGLSNGASFLHDARRARTPLLCVIGDHTSWHAPLDPPLASDIETIARGVCVGVVRLRHVHQIEAQLAEAIALSELRGGPVAVIVPQDLQSATVTPPPSLWTKDPSRSMIESSYQKNGDLINDLWRQLSQTTQTTWILGGKGLETSSQRYVSILARHLGHKVYFESFPAVLRRGGHLPVIEKLPYFPDAVLGTLRGSELIVLCGAEVPLSFFGYEGVPSYLVPQEATLVSIQAPDGSVDDTLRSLILLAGLNRDLDPNVLSHRGGSAMVSREMEDDDPLDGDALARLIVSDQCEGDVIVDEGRTGVAPYFGLANFAPEHLHLGHSGGAIGEGMPLGLGAALADRSGRVTVIQADGGGLYAPQTLWTMAREAVNVVIIVISNRAYRILQIELERSGASLDRTVASLTNLSNPTIDWVSLAKGFGVPAVSVNMVGQGRKALETARETSGPYLIEALMAP